MTNRQELEQAAREWLADNGYYLSDGHYAVPMAAFAAEREAIVKAKIIAEIEDIHWGSVYLNEYEDKLDEYINRLKAEAQDKQ